MPEVIINGPEGRIEGRYTPGKTEDAPIALFLHPHPVHGGTMNNKVVYAMFHHFAQRGFATLRFNFRGVGRSQGEYDKGEGELSDAASVLDWLQSQNPNAKQCWVAGFSFGAWIGMQLLMRRPEITGFISVAPPANLYDFSFLAPCPSSGLMLQGDADEIVPADSVEKLAEKLNLQQGIHVDYHLESGADHFFTDMLEPMTDRISAYLDANGPDRI